MVFQYPLSNMKSDVLKAFFFLNGSMHDFFFSIVRECNLSLNMLKCRSYWMQILLNLFSPLFGKHCLSLSNKYGHLSLKTVSLFLAALTQFWVVTGGVKGWSIIWLAQGAVILGDAYISALPLSVLLFENPPFSSVFFAWIDQLWYFPSIFHQTNFNKSLGKDIVI